MTGEKVVGHGQGLHDGLDEDDFQRFSHPVVRQQFKKEKYKSSLPNRFLETVYLKYPFLIPKTVPKEGLSDLSVEPANKYLISSYQYDYCMRKGEEFDFVTCPGMQVPLPEKKQYRDPELPYMLGTRECISDLAKHNWPKMPPPPELSRRETPFKWRTEYKDNINGAAAYFKRLEIYTKPFVRARHMPTLRQ